MKNLKVLTAICLMVILSCSCAKHYECKCTMPTLSFTRDGQFKNRTDAAAWCKRQAESDNDVDDSRCELLN